MNFRRRQIAFLIFAYFFIKLLAKQRRQKIREKKSPFRENFFSLYQKNRKFRIEIQIGRGGAGKGICYACRMMDAFRVTALPSRDG